VGKFDDYFWLLPVAIFGFFAWRFMRSGSLTGAMLGGRIVNTVGEIALRSSAFTSSVLKVHVFETKSDVTPQVALTIVSKAPLAVSMVPYKLSRDQAKQLAVLLEQAASSG
jgi:hypothetical protein